LEFLQTVRREQNVCESSIPIRGMKLLDDCAKGNDLSARAFGVPKGDQLHFGAILSLSKINLLDPFQSLCLHGANENGSNQRNDGQSPERICMTRFILCPSSLGERETCSASAANPP
jgi:hypothetical protein